MSMHRHVLLASLALAACGEGARAPSSPARPASATPPSSPASPRERVVLAAPPARTVPAAALTPSGRAPSWSAPRAVTVPDLGQNALFSTAGAASLASSGAPGSASVSAAPLADPNNSAPPAVGGGAFSITVGAATYAAASAESIAYTFTDQSPSGATVDYLVLGAWTITLDPATQVEIGSVVYIVTPTSDFTPGAAVALDGVDRYALFFSGDLSLPDPQVAALATTGTVSFTAGGLALGDLFDASVAGDFAELTLTPSNPPTPTPTPGAIVPGTYDLAYLPSADVFCDGSLAGQEVAFSGLVPADFGFADGVVTVGRPTADHLDVAGVAGFGASLGLDADPSAPPGLLYTVVPGSGAGPLSTQRAVQFFVLDDGSASASQIDGMAGVGFETSTQDGFCQVSFALGLTP